MIIGGLEKFSLIDYPEHLSAIVFTQGCNFRCHFCYNPMLVVSSFLKPVAIENGLRREDDKLQNIRQERPSKKSYPSISEDSLFIFLKSRIGKLDGIVISGGEPTLQPDLPVFIAKIKELGFRVKLDTNGTNPGMLNELLENQLIDYIAMDIKAPLGKYQMVVNVETNLNNIKESIKMIMEAKVPYEFRTTIVPDLHSLDDIKSMGEMIRGSDKWYLQKFQGETPLVNNNYLDKQPSSDLELEEMVEIAKSFVQYSAFR